MTFVSQGHHVMGCALACIASVTDLSYEEARGHLKTRSLDPDKGLYLEDIRRCLIKLGKKVPPSTFVPKKNRNSDWIMSFLFKQKKSCILLADNFNEIPNTFHCVVWDAKQKCFWDPSGYGYTYYSEYYRVYRIITIK